MKYKVMYRLYNKFHYDKMEKSFDTEIEAKLYLATLKLNAWNLQLTFLTIPTVEEAD